MLAELPRIPEEAQGLAAKLADLAHDQDPAPCIWASPRSLTVMLYGEDSQAARRRFRRRVEMLIEAGVIGRAHTPHHGRPKTRQCPKDGRRFHVEVLPIVDAWRP